MKAVLISIGDELLIGQVINSNAAFIGQQLTSIGIEVLQILAVADDRKAITDALDFSLKNADLAILTGGLGPTKDDITKKVFCDFFDDRLVENKELLSKLRRFFEEKLQIRMTEINEQQAYLPSKATLLENKYGTASGMWMRKENTDFISLPGVPFEMKELMRTEVVPRLQEHYALPFIVHKTMLVYGIGESLIAEKIEDVEEALPEYMSLSYLPNLGRVRLRLTARGENEEALITEIDKRIDIIAQRLGTHYIGLEGVAEIERLIVEQAQTKQLTIASAESFTGGGIAKRLTSVAGASKVFKGSVVAYHTSIKESLLNVDSKLIEQHSVVSKEVAEAMATGLREKMHCDIAIATTGNAGPSRGDSDAEVGTAVIAISTENGCESHVFYLGNHRTRITEKAINKGLELLYAEILNNADINL